MAKKFSCRCQCDAGFLTSSDDDSLRESDSEGSSGDSEKRRLEAERRARKESRTGTGGSRTDAPVDELKDASLFYFSATNRFRLVNHWIVRQSWFAAVIMFVIFANLVMLALEEPGLDPSSDLAAVLRWGNIIVMAVFTLECAMKIVAYGFLLGEHAYLKSGWNRLDFGIVVLGFVFLLPTFQRFSAIRALRTLRALKSLNAVPGLRSIVETLVQSLKPLGYVLVLEVIFITLFAILGNQFFSGKLRNRCVLSFANGSSVVGDDLCGDHSCPTGEECLPVGSNPNFGLVGYDHYGISFLTLLQIFTLDSWDTDVMDRVLKTYGRISIIYFIFAVLIGAFFVTNLMLAVAANSYSKSQEGFVTLSTEQSDVDDYEVGEPTIEFAVAEQKIRESCDYCRIDVILRNRVPDEVYTAEFKTVDGTAVSRGEDNDFVETAGTLVFDNNQVKLPVRVKIHDDEEFEEEEHFFVRLGNLTNGAVLGKCNQTKVIIVDDDDPGVFTFEKSSLSTGIIGEDEDEEKHSFTCTIFRTHGTDGHATVEFSTRDGTAVAGRHYEAVSKVLSFDAAQFRASVTVKLLKDAESPGTDRAFRMRLKHPSLGAGLGISRAVVVVRGTPHPVRRLCNTIITSPYFEMLIMGVILLNTIALALESPQNNDEQKSILHYFNIGFTVVFAVELVLKLIGLNFLLEWLPDRMNLFDAGIVTTAILELILTSSNKTSDSVPGFSALRSFRLLRVFKLARRWKSLRKITHSVIMSLSSVGYLGLIILLYVVIFSLMGMQLFGGTYGLFDPKPRFNYDTFFWSTLSIFRILIGQWSEGMRYAYTATNVAACAFYIVAMVVGIFLVLNLFLAILLNSFAQAEKELSDTLAERVEMAIKAKNERSEENNTHVSASNQVVAFDGNSHKKDNTHGLFGPMDEVHENIDDKVENHAEKEREFRIAMTHTSLFLFSPEHAGRLLCAAVVRHWVYEWTVRVLVLLSSLCLAFEDPFEQNSSLAKLLFSFNIFFAVVFFLEMVLQMVTRGGLLHEGAYLRDPWNRLDAGIVLISIVSLVLYPWKDRAFVRIFLALRAFRPLRAIERINGMRIVVNALIVSVPAIFNVVLVCLLFYLNFAILGVQIFGGKFYRCSDASFSTRDTCLGAGMDWENEYFNFDNVPWALVSLLQIATFDDWHLLFFNGIDVTAIDSAPQQDASWYYAAYFIVFIVFGSFFVLNLFIGVLIDQFNKLKEDYGGMALLSAQQNEFIQVMNAIKLFNPKHKMVQANGFRGQLQQVVQSREFEWSIMGLIGLSIVLLASNHFGASAGYERFVTIASAVFSALFLLEAGLKIFAMRSFYFKSWWNRFDFFVVIMSLLAFIPLNQEQFDLRAFRVIRLARVFKILKNVTGLRKLMTTLIYAAPSLANIGSLLFLVFFIYAVLGMALFGQMKYQDGLPLSEDLNFREFGHAFHALFKISTGPGWSSLMTACSNRENCDPDKNECGHPSTAIPFFLSFLLMMTFVMINLFIAVILEAFSQVECEEERAIRPSHFEEFGDVWSKHDPSATHQMSFDDVVKVLRELPAPLGYRGRPEGNDDALLMDLIVDPELGPDIPAVTTDTGERSILYFDLLHALVKNAMGKVELPEQQKASMDSQLAARRPRRLRNLRTHSLVGGIPTIVEMHQVVSEIMEMMTRHEAEAGDVLALAGPCQDMLFIGSGVVTLEVGVGSLSVHVGEFLGEGAVLDEASDYLGDVIAKEECVYFALDIPALRQYLQTRPGLEQHLRGGDILGRLKTMKISRISDGSASGECVDYHANVLALLRMVGNRAAGSCASSPVGTQPTSPSPSPHSPLPHSPPPHAPSSLAEFTRPPRSPPPPRDSASLSSRAPPGSPPGYVPSPPLQKQRTKTSSVRVSFSEACSEYEASDGVPLASSGEHGIG